ncbi:endo alpha-1,4 polygalactosaminidase [Dongia sedimenti]|uniref:Endo alpha-1,4 polygalactosaminidase n=1 Tax=Dongia sedimenti TaxID=3064282 RepID=A0ABU0YHA0_9PROT|nr:endo alpha-1,4 polygalactosaminidase [Rhodospirillaceae bacterium R-7]
MKIALSILLLLLPSAAVAEPIKRPPRDAGFAISLSEPVLRSQPDIRVYDLDLFDAEPSTIAALHAGGGYVICYFSAGSFEDWRPDVAQFPKHLLGKAYAGWPGERWLDIRERDELARILGARLDLAAQKDCDAVDPDNVDGFANPTGFGITIDDQRAFNLWLAEAAHARRLAVGLKNAAELVGDLVEHFDFSIVESCAAQDSCAAYQPFAARKKPVFQIEYREETRDWASVCRGAAQRGFTAIRAGLALDGTAETCPRP